MSEVNAALAGKGDYAISARFQISLMVLSVIILTGMFVYADRFVRIQDPYVTVSPLTPQKRLEFGGRPAELQIGYVLRDFPIFDMTKGQFVVDLLLYFLFDPRLISLDRINDFVFKRGTVVSQRDPVIKIVEEKLFVQHDLRLKFDVSLNYKDFPFDGHRLNFVLYHPRMSPDEVYYTSLRNDFLLAPQIQIPGWNIIDWHVSTGFEEESLAGLEETKNAVSYHPSVVFSIDFGRSGSRHIMTIFIPLILIFFISLLTLSLNPLSGARTTMLSLAAASITALITYRFVIENMSPAVGYLLIVDRIFLVFLIVCCLVFLVTIFGSRINWFYKSCIVLCLHTVILVTFGLFFLG